MLDPDRKAKTDNGLSGGNLSRLQAFRNSVPPPAPKKPTPEELQEIFADTDEDVSARKETSRWSTKPHPLPVTVGVLVFCGLMWAQLFLGPIWSWFR